MSITALSSPQDNPRPPRLWTRAEFHRAAELGLFGPQERLELIEGEILERMGENPPHSHAVRLSRRVLERCFRDQGAFLSEQHPVVLTDMSEPEPDLAVIAGDLDEFASRHPEPAEVLLLMEVANSTLPFDRTRKARIYAESGIREYWILNLIDRYLEVHREPQNGAYQSITILAEDATVSPLAAPTAAIAVRDMLP